MLILGFFILCFSEYQSCYKYAGLIDELPKFSKWVFPDELAGAKYEPTALCKKAREAYRDKMKELRQDSGQGKKKNKRSMSAFLPGVMAPIYGFFFF